MKMGGFSPEEIKEQLKSVAHEYSIGDWALEYIAQLEAEVKRLRGREKRAKQWVYAWVGAGTDAYKRFEVALEAGGDDVAS